MINDPTKSMRTKAKNPNHVFGLSTDIMVWLADWPPPISSNLAAKTLKWLLIGWEKSMASDLNLVSLKMHGDNSMYP